MFYPDGSRRDFAELALAQQTTELCVPQGFLPTFMGKPFVVALPIKIGLVAESVREKVEKFTTTTERPRLGEFAFQKISRAMPLAVKVNVQRRNLSIQDQPRRASSRLRSGGYLFRI